MPLSIPPTVKRLILPALLSLALTAILPTALQADSSSDAYLQATQLYESGNYAEALAAFRKAIQANRGLIARFPQTQYKIGYCYYRTAQYDSVIAVYSRKSPDSALLADYQDYFIEQSRLARKDTSSAIAGLRRFDDRFPDSPLVARVDSQLADIYFRRHDWRNALRSYQALLKYRSFDAGDIYGRLLDIAAVLKDAELVATYGMNLMKSYPFHPKSREAYPQVLALYRQEPLPQGKLRLIFDYLIKTRQFEQVKTLLAAQRQYEPDSELLRWLIIKSEYEQKNYWAAYKSCMEQRKFFKGQRFLREVDLHIARCHLRLGFVDKAIDAYSEFQKRYPKDALAAEVLWVIAWLSEEQGDIAAAQKFYKRLVQHYASSEFVKEARFRVGLSDYRTGNFSAARHDWESALRDEKDTFWTARFRFWIAKSFAAQRDSAAYRANLDSIAADPFDSYYSMKAFLLTRSGREIRQFVDSLLWQFQYSNTSYLPRFLEQFRRPLLVQEVYGDHFARAELSALAGRIDRPGWEIIFALGEVNEKMQNFGRAYRFYRRVYDDHFSGKDWRQWIFLFKHLYPLYFDGEVNENARKWNIIPASIWAIIKKESAFEPQITSYANAYGLMQIIPPTADRLSQNLGMELADMRQLFEPKINILLGSYYLSQLLKRYDGNLYYALAAYNAGEHRVDRWRKVLNTDDDDFFMENIEFEQTRAYVRGVMKFYWTYRLLIHPLKLSEDFRSFPVRSARDPWFHDSRSLQ